MKALRLNPLIVAVIGAVACLAAFGSIFYFGVVPKKTALTAAEARYNAAASDADPVKQASAKADVLKAQTEVDAAQVQWRQIESTKMPPYDVSHRFLAWQQLQRELALNLGPSLLRWIPKTGVVPLTDITLPAPPPSPNTVTAAPLIIPIGSGTTSVGGSFPRILNHVRQWNNFNRLVLIDGLQLHGNSPYMKGDYTAKVIIFPQNDATVDKPIASAGAATTTP